MANDEQYEKIYIGLITHLEASANSLEKMLYQKAIEQDPTFKNCNRDVFYAIVHTAFFSGGLKLMTDSIVEGSHPFKDPQIENAIRDAISGNEE